MTSDLTQFWAVGSLLALTGLSTIFLVVRNDLIPRRMGLARVDGRVFLGIALGAGVIAFGVKLLIVALVSNFPSQPIDHQRVAVSKTQGKSPNPDRAGRYWRVNKPVIWRALPETAPAPANNPTTPAKVALGRRLFHDPNLSADGSVSCATCHDVGSGVGEDGRPRARGIHQAIGTRNTPTVFNAAFQRHLFWDGRAASLEAQVLGPLLSPAEMGMASARAIVDRVRQDPAYEALFARAFGDAGDISIDAITKAIAAYERTLITPDSPYDRFVRGDTTALTGPQKRGMWLFQDLGCVDCHTGPNFSGASLIGPRQPFRALLADRTVYADQYGLTEDKGRARATAKNGIWRVPSLRNVALTAPYFHNGSVATLEEAVRVMAASQLNAVVDIADADQRVVVFWAPESGKLTAYKRPYLSPVDVADIAAFLRALTSDRLAARADKSDE